MKWLIYGANGYTGRLIARQAVHLGLAPVLAGRNPTAILPLAEELQLESRIFDLGFDSEAEHDLRGIDVVLNCAGPFIRTAAPMMEACLEAGAHYFDITGEIAVFEAAQRLDERARAAGIVICPGVGFDVVPTDCAALLLKETLPDATELSLGFQAGNELSPGTAKTAVEGLGDGGWVRRRGEMLRVPFAYAVRRIDFGKGERLAMSIPWGDVSSAFYTTGIPDITTYIPAAPAAIRAAKVANLMRPLLRSRLIKGALSRQIEKKVKGPDQTAMEKLRTYIWGEARNASGKTATVRFTTPSGYALTVDGALSIVRSFLEGRKECGTWTPARLMGKDFVFGLSGVTEARLQVN
ncbi:saccharopine dehydrogenase family protein [Noviherbaspirillum massiliense]|uniref:saccharopine dehydrogenase family protein n=1 Tax=Noviherbaspirillum massiliense TaxID=1465823 RepID=UPI0002E18B91|nr:saccharopine dehydrogenase NADP-binding domain-containing protein [Noviherbaspirillum massiliense]